MSATEAKPSRMCTGRLAPGLPSVKPGDGGTKPAFTAGRRRASSTRRRTLRLQCRPPSALISSRRPSISTLRTRLPVRRPPRPRLAPACHGGPYCRDRRLPFRDGSTMDDPREWRRDQRFSLGTTTTTSSPKPTTPTPVSEITSKTWKRSTIGNPTGNRRCFRNVTKSRK
jgi:hypothetical protein